MIMWKDPLFFAENITKGNINLSMLKMSPFPQTADTDTNKRDVVAHQHDITHYTN
jgi:hypothetical protein